MDQDPSPVWDDLNLDLVVKILAHTAFSPFFLSLIPVFYIFQGASTTSHVVVWSTVYCVIVCCFWSIRWLSRLWRNQGNLLFGPSKLDWGEQIVVVTGGASGVGELIANTLAVRSVNVVVLDVKPIVTENYNITYYKCDVSKWEEVERVSKQIVEELGHPTILINNAGVVQGKLLVDLTPEDVQQTLNVNTLAHFWTLKAFLPEMIKQNAGHIITIGSVMSLVGSVQMTDYAASKHALYGLHESLRYELDKSYKAPGVRTTLVCPGHIQTPMFSHWRPPPFAISRFLAPSLQPITVAKAVIAALDQQHSQIIYLPFYVNFSVIFRVLPSFVRDFLQMASGADSSMKHFVKITGRRPEEGAAPLVQVSNREDRRDE